MLGLQHSLDFPKLVYVKDVNFKSRSETDESKSSQLYRLDWTSFDRKQKEKFEKWRDENWKDHGMEYVPSLPENYDKWMDGLRFAINHSYKNEIYRNTRRSLEEWGIKRSFDTVIREMCLKPAEMHVEVAFKLIADCMYDEDTNYFYRGSARAILSHALLYRFWFHQTGRGLVKVKAEWDKLEWKRNDLNGDAEKMEVELFMADIERHGERREKEMCKMLMKMDMDGYVADEVAEEKAKDV